MDIRKKATEFITELNTQEVLQIPSSRLKTICSEFLKTTDQRTIKPVFDYLKETGLIIQINTDKDAPYTINYERNEQLKDPAFKWVNATSKLKRIPEEQEEPINETKEAN